MSKRVFVLSHPEARQRAAQTCQEAPQGFVVTVAEPTRTLEQNAAQWPILAAFAAQKQAVINGRLEWVTDEDWKDILTAAFNNELTRVALGLDGRMVLLGQRTSKFGKGKFSNWIEFLNATAAEMGVVVYPPEYEPERLAQ
jgi:hypothetical protein